MHINIMGVINKTGFGTHAKNMIKAFDSIDISTAMIPISNVMKSDANELVIKSLKSKLDIDSPYLYLCHDGYLTTQKPKSLIMFQVFETTILRADTLARIDNYAYSLFTPTLKHKQLLLDNGVTKDIHVVHEGVNPEMFNSNVEDKLIETNKYTYLLLGKNEARKNTTMVIQGFLNTMKDQSVALICHTANHMHSGKDLLKNWSEIDVEDYGYNKVNETDNYIKFTNGISDIYYSKPVLKDVELKSLYHSANVGISYSRGEGWGLPEMEMMACGVPVIISNVLGHEEYLKDQPVFRTLIVEPSGYEPADDGVYFNGTAGDWAIMSNVQLESKLLYAYTNTVGMEISKELSEYYTTNYSWAKAAQQIKEILF